MSASLAGTGIDAPYPGLRPFEAEESLIFFGRETHVAELLDRLGDQRFVAVTGTSGSGKSSLVRAGLWPALRRGYLADASSKWRFVTMRPGGAPIERLADELAPVIGLPLPEVVAALTTSSAGLAEIVERAAMASGESLLIIADQFEELFRFEVTRDQEASTALFVSLLLEASARRRPAIYVVATMRSEFLGRCSEFAGLAEAFNRSQYLVPRLTRDQRQAAIERPLRLFGTEASPALVQQVLNDAGDDPDQLPVLQHVLLRTYRHWVQVGRPRRVERDHYEHVGRIERALDKHGDEILEAAGERDAALAGPLFRSLTVTQGGVAVRRPKRLQEIYDIVGPAKEARASIDALIMLFVQSGNNFLSLSERTLTPATVVDLTHESLIRKWKRLDGWVREEARSAEWYEDVSRDVLRFRSGDGGLWHDPLLAAVQRRRQSEAWTEAWANQYRRETDPPFADATTFLDDSAAAQRARQEADEKLRTRDLVQARSLARSRFYISIGLAVLLVVVGAAAFLFYRLADSQRQVNLIEQENARLARAFTDKSAEAEQTQKLLTSRQAELEKLQALPQSSGTDTKIEALKQEIAATQAQAKAREDELGKLRQNQALQASDRGALLKRIEDLQQDRERLQAQLQVQRESQSPPPVAAVTVPDLSGRAATTVAAQLAASGLKLGEIQTVESATVTQGTVVVQQPRPGTRVPRGTAVDVAIAAAPRSPEPLSGKVSDPGTPEDAADLLRLLQRYRDAYQARDFRALAAVYPSAEPGLENLFRDYRSVTETIRVDNIVITGATARIETSVEQTITPRAGRNTTQRGKVVFNARRSPGGWSLERVEWAGQ